MLLTKARVFFNTFILNVPIWPTSQRATRPGAGKQRALEREAARRAEVNAIQHPPKFSRQQLRAMQRSAAKMQRSAAKMR